MTDLTGLDISRYHIVEQLGQGGMAVVYRAYDTRLERQVALKLIRIENFAPNVVGQMLTRFEREARSLAKLMHPNIIPIFDYGEYEGSPYLVMPYISGGTLKQRTGKPMPYQEAARILAPTARALEYAHQREIIHRDVKPANILIGDNGIPLLSDFGVAKILETESGNTLTGTGTGIGTPEYMPPEQWENKVEPRTDIYALGVVLYELVTGRKPFTADTPAAILRMVYFDPLPRPKQFVPNLPDEVENVIYKAMAKKVEERYASSGELAAALENLASSLPAPGMQPAEVETQVREIAPVQAPEYKTTVKMDALKPAKAVPYQTTQVGGGEIKGSLPPPVYHFESPPEEQKPPQASEPFQKKKPPRWLVIFGSVLGTTAVVLCLVFVIVPFFCVALPAVLDKLPTATSQYLIAKTPVAPQATLPPSRPATAIPPQPTAAIPSAPARTVQPTSVYKIGTSKVSEKDGMVEVIVPEGDFQMGSDSGYGSPVHTVWLDAFWIDQEFITNAMFKKFVDQTGYKTDAENSGSSNVVNDKDKKTGGSGLVRGANWRRPLGPDFVLTGIEDHPVVQVSWKDARAYCEWAQRRLPTEAEWEKAARGTDGRIYPWGNQPPDKNLLNYNKNINATTPLFSYPSGASPYGTLDMAGNVFQWVMDWFDEKYYSSQSEWRNPQGPANGKNRVLRGSSYVTGDVKYLISADRSPWYPEDASNLIGFRCALDDQK